MKNAQNVCLGWESLSFFVLVVIVALRPLISETYDSGGLAMTNALEGISDSSPVTTIVFDVLILLSATLCVIGRVLRREVLYRRTGLVWGLGLIIIAAIVSTWFAGNKRLAMNASLDWTCMVILAITLTQLLSTSWWRRILLGAILASVCAQAVQCYDQYFWGYDQTWEHYQSIKEHLWAKQGVPVDSPQVALFERRMQSREASGFFPHSNIAGSYLVLCSFAAFGLVMRFRHRANDSRSKLIALIAAMLALFIAGAMILTTSLGAMISGAAGLVLWGFLVSARCWIDAHRKAAYLVAWAIVVVGAVSTIGYGFYRDGLPHSSLDFRWKYWTASAELAADHSLTGVGRENFGTHYLKYKRIDSPEEISTPHNLFIQAWAEWGAPGLIGIVALLIGGSWAISRPLKTSTRQDTTISRELNDRARSCNTQEPQASACAVLRTQEYRTMVGGHIGTRDDQLCAILLWVMGLAAVILPVRIRLLGIDNASFIYLSTVMVGLPWIVGFMVFTGQCCITTPEQKGSACTVSMGIAVGLFTFLLHDMINFALFVPGSATMFFALIALCLSERGESSKVYRVIDRRIAVSLAIGLGLVTIVVTVFVLWPVAKCWNQLQEAREAASKLYDVPLEDQPAYTAFAKAAQADALDPTPYSECAGWLMAVAGVDHNNAHAGHREEAEPLALESSRLAALCDPNNPKYDRLIMRIHAYRAQRTGNKADYLAAVESAKNALSKYPLDPDGLVQLADVQLAAGETTGSDELIRLAISNYEKAITLDDSRPDWEIFHRFSDRQRGAIEEALDHARELLD